jgi:hypothetical protein
MAAERPDEARYLQEKARQFRELAETYKTEISGKLIEIAKDLEARAAKIEKKRPRHLAAPPETRVDRRNAHRRRLSIR